MNRKISELKRIARGNLKGNYTDLIRVFVACNFIVSFVEMPFSMLTNEVAFSTQNLIYYAATILIGIASVVLTAGQYRIHLGIARTGERHLSELFVPARKHSNQFIMTEFLLYAISLVVMLPMIAAIFWISRSQRLEDLWFVIPISLVSLLLSLYVSLLYTHLNHTY